MSVTPTPSDKGSPEETFRQLATDFELDKAVYEYILLKKMKTLRDFRFWFSSEDECKTFMAEIRGVQAEDQQLQTSKLRQAWHAVKSYIDLMQKDKSAGTEAELEDMLKAEDLERRKTNFWQRHKSDVANEVYPADTLISRAAREMDKRMLLVYDVSVVRNLLYQITTHKKKKQAVPGADLWTHDSHEVRTPPRDWFQYLEKLQTYLLALAIAGCNPVPGAPAAAEENKLGSDSTSFVLVPLDTVQRYWHRAKYKCLEVPEGHRLAWLRDKDTQERSLWVKHFQNSSRSLGQVISMVYDLRDAHWEYSKQHQSSYSHNQEKPELKRRRSNESYNANPGGSPLAIKDKPSGGKDSGKGDKPLPYYSKFNRQIASETRNGIKFCPDFQAGACAAKGKGCGKGRHMCGVLIDAKLSRFCGALNHGAKNHPDK